MPNSMPSLFRIVAMLLPFAATPGFRAAIAAAQAALPEVLAQEMPSGMNAQDNARPVPLIAGLGNAHHTIATKNPEAQLYFDQGINYIYAFNHEEARRSFARAAALAPSDPMPLWGIALAVGPNYNDLDIGHVRARQAIAALARARALVPHAPAEERAYVAALSARYGKDRAGQPTVQGTQYTDAMAIIARRYPNDPDAGTLYAESLMDLNPWKLWTADGRPAPRTESIVATLHDVLARFPNYVGANHLLIHAVEASPNPGLATASAQRLQTLAPAAGHLVHMPAHIYERTGDFDDAATANQHAVTADRAYFHDQHLEGVENMYNFMYYTHNMHFLAASCSMEGNAACTGRAAAELVQHILPEIAASPISEWYTPTQPWMLVRFNQWAAILVAPAPPVQDTILAAMVHYARGCAYAAIRQLSQARAERAFLAPLAAAPPSGMPDDFNTPAKTVFSLALHVLDARIAQAAGQPAEALAQWSAAVTLWDTIPYNEPPDWYYPVRESLGGQLLRMHRSAEAEAVFRRDLEVNRGNGRSLFGLWQSLDQQGKTAAAASAEADFHRAWRNADSPLSIDTL